jgi:hypothetical protein
MRKVLRIGSERKPKTTKQENTLSAELNTRIEMIQALIPLGLMAVAEQLEEEVKELAGERYSRQGGLPGHHRWGSQRKPIYLSDQKMHLEVTRVRNSVKNEEVALHTSQALQSPRQADEGLLRRILLGLSCRNYQTCAEAIPEAFGLSSSSVSRRFIKASVV